MRTIILAMGLAGCAGAAVVYPELGDDVALAGVATVAVDAPAPAGGATTYKLDPAQGALYVVLKYDRSALMAGHDHVIQASTFTGSVTWSATDPTACKVDIRFPVSALVVDPPGSRARAGFEGETSDGDKKKIAENMWGKGQLDASSFPEISYQATKCEGTTGSVKVSGNLRIHGVSKAVTLTMNVTADGSAFAAKGSTNITHGMFGFSPFTAGLGMLKNDDNLKLVVDVKGRP